MDPTHLFGWMVLFSIIVSASALFTVVTAWRENWVWATIAAVCATGVVVCTVLIGIASQQASEQYAQQAGAQQGISYVQGTVGVIGGGLRVAGPNGCEIRAFLTSDNSQIKVTLPPVAGYRVLTAALVEELCKSTASQ